MICPHCSTVAHFKWNHTDLIKIDQEANRATHIAYALCPACSEPVIYLEEGIINILEPEVSLWNTDFSKMIYPEDNMFQDNEFIPKIYLDDYDEALKTLSSSPKSSAALSRRLVQNIIREEYKISEKSLSLEIQKFISLPGIPSHIVEAIEAIRIVGNLAAHPAKDQNTGEIVAVEAGEAEWLIEVIEALFDFTFVQPEKLKSRKEELNKKLATLGKPLMK